MWDKLFPNYVLPPLPLKVGGHVPPAPMGAPPMVEGIHCSTSLYNVHCSESLQTQLETVQCRFQSVLCSSCNGTAAVMVAAVSGSRSRWQSGLAVGIQCDWAQFGTADVDHNVANSIVPQFAECIPYLTINHIYARHTKNLVMFQIPPTAKTITFRS